jgi:hypothetical protein
MYWITIASTSMFESDVSFPNGLQTPQAEHHDPRNVGGWENFFVAESLHCAAFPAV